jgi:hypothetical protein
MISRTFMNLSWLACGVGLGLAIANFVLLLGGGSLSAFPLVLTQGFYALGFAYLTNPAGWTSGRAPWAHTELRAVIAFLFVWAIPFNLTYLVLNQFGWIDGAATPWVMAALVASLIVGVVWTAIYASHVKRHRGASGHGRAATG